MKSIIEIYNYREMLFNLVKKDLRTRYKGSFLGFLWTLLNPLLQLAVYSIIFSMVMRVDIENYPVYLFVGLIPWIFFSAAISNSMVCIISNKEMIKKIYFPRIIIPISVVSSAWISMLFSMIIVILALIVFKVGISWHILLLPIPVLIEYIMILGFSLLLSSLNVFFRDLEHIFSIIIMAWFYMTPIVYTIDMIPDQYLYIFRLNPMVDLIQMYREILFYHQMPGLNNIGALLVISIFILSIRGFVFSKVQKRFAEEL